MATTAKWRVFRYGQKRGLCPLAIRAILRTMGCPPTLAEVPAQRFHFIKMGGSFPDGKRSFRDPDDLREISPLAEESAKKIIDITSAYHQMRRMELEYPLQSRSLKSI